MNHTCIAIASEPASYIINKTYADLCAYDVDNPLPEHTKIVKVAFFKFQVCNFLK